MTTRNSNMREDCSRGASLKSAGRAVHSDIQNSKAVSSTRRKALWAACLAHVLHDGYTDQLYALLPVWQEQFGLSYGGLAAVRALYFGTMSGLQIPGGRGVQRVGVRQAL